MSRFPPPRVVGNSSSSAASRLPPPRAVGDPSSSAFSRLPPARAVGDPSSSAFSHLPPPRAVGDPSSSAFSRLPPPRAVGDPSSSAFSRLPPARAVGDPSSSAFSRLSPPRAVGDPSSSAFSRLPPPRTVGDPSSSAFSRLPPPRAVGDPSSSAFSRLPPPRAVGDPSSSAFSRLPSPRAVGNPSSSALSRLPPVPRWPSARFHGLLIVGRLHGSDLTRRSSPLSSLRTSVGVTGSARMGAAMLSAALFALFHLSLSSFSPTLPLGFPVACLLARMGYGCVGDRNGVSTRAGEERSQLGTTESDKVEAIDRIECGAEERKSEGTGDRQEQQCQGEDCGYGLLLGGFLGSDKPGGRDVKE
ncbi:unnamed protein product [Closterium sp. NIES-65]|nr:unnamed protein product [Closterium sp. NIES-65]